MLNHKERQLVSIFLFSAGHAHVQFVGDKVAYRDQTRGYHAKVKLIDPQPILDVIGDRDAIETDKLALRLIMLQVDPFQTVWEQWPRWQTLPDQVYEMQSWTNDVQKLLEISGRDFSEELNEQETTQTT